IGGNEALHGHKEELRKWANKSDEFKVEFFDEFQRYANRQYPYNSSFKEEVGIYSWWRSLLGLEYGKILPILAVKVFSVRINSMPEERTGSTFTWLTPALRANLSIDMVVAMTQIRQYYHTDKKKHSHQHPTPKYYLERKKEMAAAAKSVPVALLDTEDDTWLDVPLKDDEMAKTGMNLNMLDVNLNSSIIAGIFSEEKVTKKQKGQGKAEGSQPATSSKGTSDFSFDW
ncbi:hypothetical protein BDN72DRAFT_864759, partial [Pluteus cervinus]